jgi:hypothetical protein
MPSNAIETTLSGGGPGKFMTVVIGAPGKKAIPGLCGERNEN